MSLITINPDFKLLLKEFRRLADAAEAFLRLQYTYDSDVARAERQGKKVERVTPDDVQYATDEKTAELELKAAKRGLESVRDEVEDDEDQSVFYENR